jgi:ATP-dependent Lon protease
MYKIQTKGYDTKEKVVIAKKYLLPKIREQVNFKEEDIIIPDETIQYLISSAKFTQNEQGVRNLKRCLEIIYTKLNLFRLMKLDEECDSQKILGKNNDLKVTFPFTVTKLIVDKLIRGDDNQNQSLLAMYV